MKFVCAQHIIFEPPGNLIRWTDGRGDSLEVLKMFADYQIPSPKDFDGLFILGGPMSVNDEEQLAWLREEKDLVRAAIKADKPVLGICLGGQMIAEVLGAEVRPMGYREIGFFSIGLTEDAGQNSKCFKELPPTFTAFHWHGERFSIPAGARHLAGSCACDNQAFEFGPALALQFHLEMAPDYLSNMAVNCAAEIQAGGIHVQGVEEMQRIGRTLGDQPYRFLTRILDNWLTF
jgi:GMP synthase-like glutamine amidotransferase